MYICPLCFSLIEVIHLNWKCRRLPSCSWRPPPARPPAPPSRGKWGEVPSRSLAPRCSCSRSTSPTLHRGRPRSLWRCARSNSLQGNPTWRFGKSLSGTVCQVRIKKKSYVHCLRAWSCPWGSRGSYKAAEVDVILYYYYYFKWNLQNRHWLSPLSAPVLQSIRWTGRCARCICVSSPCEQCTDGTIAESGRRIWWLKDNRWSADGRICTEAESDRAAEGQILNELIFKWNILNISYNIPYIFHVLENWQNIHNVVVFRCIALPFIEIKEILSFGNLDSDPDDTHSTSGKAPAAQRTTVRRGVAYLWRLRRAEQRGRKYSCVKNNTNKWESFWAGVSVWYPKIRVTFSGAFVELVGFWDATSHDCSCSEHQIKVTQYNVWIELVLQHNESITAL